MPVLSSCSPKCSDCEHQPRHQNTSPPRPPRRGLLPLPPPLPPLQPPPPPRPGLRAQLVVNARPRPASHSRRHSHHWPLSGKHMASPRKPLNSPDRRRSWRSKKVHGSMNIARLAWPWIEQVSSSFMTFSLSTPVSSAVMPARSAPGAEQLDGGAILAAYAASH